MYSFAQREDTTVVDEPLYAHYLIHTNSEADHPGKEEILANLENDGEKVIKNVILGDYETDIVLFKQMTHHLINIDEEFLYHAKNILLIRDPERIIDSYSKVIPNPTMQDVGIQKQFELFKKLEEVNKVAAVVDAKQLLLNPKKVLKKLCEELDIPFNKDMLSWKPGARTEDGIWAKYWYANVHQSTGFKKYEFRDVKLKGHLKSLAEEAAPYYEYLWEFAIKA